ncbi:MAG TPA: tRNA-modifying protein YgfZ, partial [Opitutaceae bacterium]
EDAERERIAACIAAVPCDIGAADLPNEAGLDQVAISYSKGCYTGQEVMARIKSLGRVRRRLVRLRGPGSPPRGGSPLWSGGARQGEIRSAVGVPAGFEALAMVAVGSSAAGERLSLSEAGPADAEVLAAT